MTARVAKATLGTKRPCFNGSWPRSNANERRNAGQRSWRRPKKMKRSQKDDVIKANVLLNQNMDRGYSLKRHWTEDTVFKNQAVAPTKKKRFINDPVRNDFHKRFMNK